MSCEIYRSNLLVKEKYVFIGYKIDEFMLEFQMELRSHAVSSSRLLREGSLIYFTTGWPLNYDWVRGKFFKIAIAIQIPYDRSWIIPAGDYRDVDLSNGPNTFQENLYPENKISLLK